MIPVGIAVGFGLLFLALFRDRLLPAQNVEVAVVLAGQMTDGIAGAPADAALPVDQGAADAPMVFQASGWVEPDPLPIKATALVDGVVDEVHVLEGERVEKGQLLATLVQEDFRLALDAASQALRMRESELVAHRKSIQAAERAVTAVRAEVDSAQAHVEETADRKDRVDGLSRGAISESEIVSIRSAYRKALAAESAGLAAVEQAEAEVERLKALTSVLESAIAAAEVEVAAAQLALSRTKIAAPVEGRVLRLAAAPGQKKRLAMDDPDSATIAILYDPKHLQVRVDVPLADAAGLQIGQWARIRCSLLPETAFQSEVTRITGEADVARNTLQAKVSIKDPSDQLRPEMLCRVEFLESRRISSAVSSQPTGSGALTTWVPEVAVSDSRAWVCDPDSKRVEPREVKSTNDTKDGFVRVAEGLSPGEWVVLSPESLKEGQRVNPELIEP